MDRRSFVKRISATALASAVPAYALRIIAPHTKSTHGYYEMAAAVLPRHEHVEEIFPVLSRYKQRGFTAVWVENDYLRWKWGQLEDQGRDGNNRLFNIFDLTFGYARELYATYFNKLGAKCSENGLDLFGSFWIPRWTTEMHDYVQRNVKDGIGATMWNGVSKETLCTCTAGGGLAFLDKMVEQYMRLSPAIRVLKVATLDNQAYVCDETCPHAHGTKRGQHLANLFGTIQSAMLRVRPDSELVVYEWFWEPGYLDEVRKQMTKPFYLLAKIEVGSIQNVEANIPGTPLFDADDLSESEGPVFSEAVKSVGAERTIEMPALGSGIDDFFFGSPPIPARLHRRFQLHRSIGCNKLIEFDCGGHWDDSNELAFQVFNAQPDVANAALLDRVAALTCKSPRARALALEGWRYFDEGFGHIPSGMGGTGEKVGISGRFGFAWTMCIATPLVQAAFADDDPKNVNHWFSPYDFFTTRLSDRLETQFLRVQASWQRAAELLEAAYALEPANPRAEHEAIAARAHVLGATSALNWCNACRYARTPALTANFADVCQLEIALTQQFLALQQKYVWVWNHICWHPHQTPMSQKQLGFETVTTHNTFEAKLQIMQRAS